LVVQRLEAQAARAILGQLMAQAKASARSNISLRANRELSDLLGGGVVKHWPRPNATRRIADRAQSLRQQ
jgi:hypothetical protein